MSSNNIDVKYDKKKNRVVTRRKDKLMTYTDRGTGEKYKISYSQELQLEQIRQNRVQNILLFFLTLTLLVIAFLISYGLLSEGFVL